MVEPCNAFLGLAFTAIILCAGFFVNSAPARADEAAAVGPEMQVYNASYLGHTFEILYQISNATLKQMTLDIASDKLAVLVNASDSGRIMLKLPRNLFWSDMLNEYNFTVFIDGKRPGKNFEPSYIENNSCYRVVSIPFPKSSQTIEMMRPATHPALRSIGNDGFIATDKPCYKQGETVTAFGFSSLPIIFNVLTPGGDYPRDNIEFARDQNGSFTATFAIKGGRAFSGEYAVLAEYRIGALPPEAADARFMIVESDYDNLTMEKVSIKDGNGGKVAAMTEAVAKVTDRYVISTPIRNDDEEPKSFQYLIMITDENNTAQQIIDGNFVALAKQTTAAGETIDGFPYFIWQPAEAGKHTVKVFFWTPAYLPAEPISSPQTASIDVIEKIVKLGTGERDQEVSLLVRYINFDDENVTVAYPVCAQEEEKTILKGEYVETSGVRAYFEGFDGNNAVFNLKLGGGNYCPF